MKTSDGGRAELRLPNLRHDDDDSAHKKAAKPFTGLAAIRRLLFSIGSATRPNPEVCALTDHLSNTPPNATASWMPVFMP
jgi:hypothetical protein